MVAYGESRRGILRVEPTSILPVTSCLESRGGPAARFSARLIRQSCLCLSRDCRLSSDSGVSLAARAAPACRVEEGSTRVARSSATGQIQG
jgi:hypothetical protein